MKNTLKLEISACWFEQTQVESKNATIYLNWKGYLYVIPITDLLYSSGCCDNTLFNVEIDLEKNILNEKVDRDNKYKLPDGKYFMIALIFIENSGEKYGLAKPGFKYKKVDKENAIKNKQKVIFLSITSCFIINYCLHFNNIFNNFFVLENENFNSLL